MEKLKTLSCVWLWGTLGGVVTGQSMYVMADPNLTVSFNVQSGGRDMELL